MSTSMRGKLEAALDAAGRGFHVFPCHASVNGACTCGDAKCPSPGKHPRVSAWQKRATNEEETIRQWWAKWPDANIGGFRPHTITLDVDEGENHKGVVKHGEAELEAAIAELGPLPETVEGISGSGSRHLDFEVTEGVELTDASPWSDIDIRIAGYGFVILPGSAHQSGRVYAWNAQAHPDDVPFAQLPDAWLRYILDYQSARETVRVNLAHVAPLNESKLESAISQDKWLAELWARHEKGGDQSASGYDFAIAKRLLKQGWSEAEIPAVWRAWREQHGEHPAKADRRDYQERTIAQVKVALSRNGHGEGLPATDRSASIYIVQQSAAPDLDNASRLVERHGARLRYCAQLGGWHIWTGTHWRVDRLGEVFELAKETIDGAISEALRESADRLAKALINARQGKRIQAMVQLAATDSRVAVEATAFDRDPSLLNCPNGTVDLRTGELREHIPENLITKVAGAPYDPEARSDRWSRFLLDVTDVNTEYIEYLQRLFGHGVCGDRSPELVAFVHGPPGTGKTTFMEAVKAAMGDYAETADFSTWIQSKHRPHGGTPREDLTRLKASRLVVSVEVSEGSRLAEGLVALVSGGDDVTARAVHARHSVRYRPQFLLTLVANHAPRISHQSPVWRRLKRLPFEHVPTERDTSLKADLRSKPEHRRAVLAWLVQGGLAWQRDGMGTAEVVERATRKYRDTADTIGEWISDHIAFTNEDEQRLTRAQIRTHFESWVKEVRYQRPKIGDLYARLERMGAVPGADRGERNFKRVAWKE